MFKALGSLFHQTPSVVSDDDIRHAVQEFFQQTLKTDQVICVGVRGGNVDVRVSNATLHQEVLLLQYDLAERLKDRHDYTLKSLRVVKG